MSFLGERKGSVATVPSQLFKVSAAVMLVAGLNGQVNEGAGQRFASSLSAAQAASATRLPELIVVQASPAGRSSPWRDNVQGSRLVRVLPGRDAPANLTPNFFAVADPRVSFDGTRVLFAGQKSPSEHWQIWEMGLDGADLHQVTACPAECFKPAYLPRGEVVYTAVMMGLGAGDKEQGTKAQPPEPKVTELWVSKLDGSLAHPITFGPGDFEVETVLMNGTILATARSPLKDGESNDRELYTLRSDGSGLAAFRCDHQHPAIRSQAEELDDGSVVFIKRGSGLMPAHGTAGRSLPGGERDDDSPRDRTDARAGAQGELAWIRAGALHNSPLTSIPVLSPRQLAGSLGGTTLEDQWVGAHGGAHRPAGKLVLARELSPAHPRLALYSFDAARGEFTGLLYADPKLDSVAAVPVTAHQPPRWYWSTLDPTVGAGYFICLNSYRSDTAAGGRLAAKLAKVRVLLLDHESTPAPARGEKVLGEVPVEADGSFYLAVPPDKPVRFELLDDAGRVVRAQRSWVWARSGEEHGCGGCHEDRAVAPENRWPLALRRFDMPARLGIGSGK